MDKRIEEAIQQSVKQEPFAQMMNMELTDLGNSFGMIRERSRFPSAVNLSFILPLPRPGPDCRSFSW